MSLAGLTWEDRVWRYYVIDHCWEYDLQLTLDKMGASGWELVSSTMRDTGIHKVFHLIFKCPA